MSDELTPITRKETFLAKAGGQNVVTPTPITREETFLQAIIDNGSGGGGGTGGGATIATGTYDDVRSDTTLSQETYEVYVIESNSGSTIPFTTNTIDGYPEGYIE